MQSIPGGRAWQSRWRLLGRCRSKRYGRVCVNGYECRVLGFLGFHEQEIESSGIGLHNVLSFVWKRQAGKQTFSAEASLINASLHICCKADGGESCFCETFVGFRLCPYSRRSAARARRVIPVPVPGTVSMTGTCSSSSFSTRYWLQEAVMVQRNCTSHQQRACPLNQSCIINCRLLD
jgi:hypothetical protein